MTLEEICYRLIPDNEDQDIALRLLQDAGLTARVSDDEELYLAYIKVIEEHIYQTRTAELRQLMLKYWKETKNER